MSCFRSDGRLLVRVNIPNTIVERADELAQTMGRDRADLLGDLVAQQLPEVLAATARALWAPDLPSYAATPPAIAEGASGLTSPKDQAALIVPGSGSEPEPDDACPS